MTIELFLGLILVNSLVLDSGLWLLYLLAPRHSKRRRIMLRVGLADFVTLLTIVLLHVALPNQSQIQVSGGWLIAAMFLLVILNAFTGFAFWSAIYRLFGLFFPQD